MSVKTDNSTKNKKLSTEEYKRELEEIARLEKELAQYEKERKEYDKKIEIYERKNKLLFFGHKDKGHLGALGKWEYNPVQKIVFPVWMNAAYKILTLTGANRISKTFSTFCMLLCAVMGRWPWEDDSLTGHFWEKMRWEPPIRIRWVGQDWEKHIKTVIEKAFDELWPEARQVESKKNNIGVRALWTDIKSGSTIEIMSNNQESDLFEGWKGHIVAYDEPPKRDNRVACARGLIDYCGREIFAMTLLKEAWVDKEVINAVDKEGVLDTSVFNFNAEIDSNIGFGITQEGVDQFAKTLSEEEKEARLRGVPSYKAGLILKLDRNKNFIESFRDIPLHWIVIPAIDIHPSKPQCVLFQAVDERNMRYLIHEIVDHGDGTWVGDQIIKYKEKHNLRMPYAIIDPLAKADKNNENSTYDKIKMVLARNGVGLKVASKDKDDGIICLNDMIWSRNNMASYFICRHLRIAIRQLNNWMYDEQGKPSKDDDDQCENAYRLALLKCDYYPPEDEDDFINNNEVKVLSGLDAGY